MAHEVFICHAYKDKVIAGVICEKLESARVRCWMAGRDISVGEDWTEVTRKAIGSSRVMVLVLSENANAAPHIEREVAHAFYTGRTIIPLRVTNTLPRRDFLFYLGNARCFDAFDPPAEEHLEAFTASINEMVGPPTATGGTVPPYRAIQEREALTFSDSWLGALQASHYQTLEILKRAAIAVPVVAVGLLLWFRPWESNPEIPLAQDKPETTFTSPHAAPDPTRQGAGERPPATPAYTYSRLGLWVAPTNGTKSSDLPEPQEVPVIPAIPQPANATPSPASDLDPKAAADTDRLGDRDNLSAASAQGDQAQRTDRQEMHRKKMRPKHRGRRMSRSEESLVRRSRNRLKAAWRQAVVRGKESE